MKYYYDRYWGCFFKRSIENGTGPATLDNGIKPTDLELIGVGYSGHPGMLNDIHSQNIANQGPLPAGTYTFSGPFTDPKRGPQCWRLEPAPTNRMFGRCAFMNHGDTSDMSHDASDGCIISPHWVRNLWTNEDTLEVL
jgi:hypothetical protein